LLHFPTNALSLPLEDFLREVRGSPGQAMQMPIQLKLGGGLGAGVHALQVIASWALSDDANRTVRLPEAFASNPSTSERFASTLPGMAALYFAESLQCGGSAFSRFRALEFVAPRVEAMQAQGFRDTLRGQAVALCSFHGAKNEFLSALYSQPRPGGVRTGSDFRLLLPRLLRSIGERASWAMNEGQLDYLSALVHQLFLNADEHGSQDSDGSRYQSGMRGVVLRVTTVNSIGALVRLAGEDTPFRSYVTKLIVLPGRRGPQRNPDEALPEGPIQLLELSVFDTGPGMGLRWLADQDGRRSYADFTPEQELAAVQTCFQKHATTKASQYFGQGLPVALAAMKRLNAFMTLRTGRLSLYQNFSRADTVKFHPGKRFPKSHALPVIAGTGYTVCFRVK
jgi:hypothetical protein